MNAARGVLIAGNWKMNHGPKAAREFADSLVGPWSRLSPAACAAIADRGLQALVFPPFLSLAATKDEFAKHGLPVSVGAQNVHWDEKGAYTGEISGPMLKELGFDWTLVGHSERRQHFGETDATVRKRAESHLKQGFRVVLCIGETRAEREAGQTEAVLERQLTQGLPALPEAGQALALGWGDRLVLAYEPVWAIGTGLTATPAQAEEAHAFVRAEAAKRYSPAIAAKLQILYGGSVTPENVAGLLDCPNVDGGLVGGASLKPESFAAMVATAGERMSARR